MSYLVVGKNNEFCYYEITCSWQKQWILEIQVISQLAKIKEPETTRKLVVSSEHVNENFGGL